MTRVHFAVVGHLTVDELEHGAFVGGSVLYAGLAAHALGAEVHVWTSIGADFPGHPGLQGSGVFVDAAPAPHTTRFVERYEGGSRTAHVLQTAPPLKTSRVLEQLDASASSQRGPQVRFICPVLNEVSREGWAQSPGTLMAAGLQGWLRRVDSTGRVVPSPLGDPRFLAPFDVVFCSDEDLGADVESEIQALCSEVPCVVVTEGARGARLYCDGRTYRVHPEPTTEVDPTGAGDTFAACFLMALAQGKDAREAAVWGACGAARVIAAPGAEGVAQLRGLAKAVEHYRTTTPWPEPI